MLFDPVKSLYYFQIYKMFFGVVFVLYFKHLIVLHKPVLRVKPPKLKSKVLTACPPRAKNQYTKGSFKKIRKLIYRKINNFRFCNAQTPETQEKRDVYNVILKLENETLCCLKKNFFFFNQSSISDIFDTLVSNPCETAQNNGPSSPSTLRAIGSLKNFTLGASTRPRAFITTSDCTKGRKLY